MVPDDFVFDPTDLNRKWGLGDDPDRAVLATDAKILWPLAHQLITCSRGQLPELFPEAPEADRSAWKKQARPELKDRTVRLVRAGLITTPEVWIRPHRRIGKPLLDWKPSDPPPDARDLSSRIREGWEHSTGDGEHPTPPSWVYRITDRGAAAVGAFVGERNTAELRRHDLRGIRLACAKHPFAPPGGTDARTTQAVGEIFMARLWQSPDLVRGWRLLNRTPTELLLPDALVYDSRDQLAQAVVYATHWCECIVGRFHRLCSSRGLAYQIYGA